MTVAPASAVPATVGAFVLTAPDLVDTTGAAGPTVSVTTVNGNEAVDVLPARSVALTVSLCEPSVSAEVVIEYFPSAPAVAEPTLLASSNISTLLPASATPVRTGVEIFVIPSMADRPVSELVSKTGDAGVSGALVSMVRVNAFESAEMFPAASFACTVST